MLVRPHDQNVPGKIGKASPAGYTQGNRPKIVQGPGGVTTSPTWLFPSWNGASKTMRLLLTVRNFDSTYRPAALATLPRENVGMKINE